jgi:hypothetical protein
MGAVTFSIEPTVVVVVVVVVVVAKQEEHRSRQIQLGGLID